MGVEAQRASVESYFATNWTTTPIEFENVNYAPHQNTPYVRMVTRVGGGYRAALGTTRFRYAGVIILSVFTPKFIGTGESNKLVDSLVTLWREKAIGAVRTYTPVARNIGDVGEWYQANVTIPFDRDDIA